MQFLEIKTEVGVTFADAKNDTSLQTQFPIGEERLATKMGTVIRVFF